MFCFCCVVCSRGALRSVRTLMRLGKSRHKDASSDTEEAAGLLDSGQGVVAGNLSRASSQTSLSSDESQHSVSLADRTPTKR